MILRILAEAEAEIDAARRYLNEQSPGLGGRFLDDLTERLNAIAVDPHRFSKLETLPDKQPHRRAQLKVFRYIIVYEILSEEIVVVAVAHASQEPNYWLGRRAI
jgi:plasmid stabilization system protein ParE